MRIFVAGATGATGQVFVPRATAAGHDLVLHVRPQSAKKSPLGSDPRAAIVDLADAPALEKAMAGCDAIVSFVGTMRNRFAAGDTYESSDVASCEQLAKAGRAAGVKRFLLLSSYGAGGTGAYLKMKARCEDIVKASGLAWTMFRPSMLVSPEGADGTHGSRGAPPGMRGLFGAIGAIPGLGGWADDTKPIPIEIVCEGFLRALDGSADGKTLTGRDLWKMSGKAP